MGAIEERAWNAVDNLQESARKTFELWHTLVRMDPLSAGKEKNSDCSSISISLDRESLQTINAALVLYFADQKEREETMKESLLAGSEDGDLRSHSEKSILNGCISLMYELFGEFKQYLEYMDIVPETDEEKFCTHFTYGQIVQELFLLNTKHSGGASTRAKCNVLGVSYSGEVVFDAMAADED